MGHERVNRAVALYCVYLELHKLIIKNDFHISAIQHGNYPG